MYKVHRDEKRITITDWKNQVVYTADLDAVVIHELAGQLRTDTIGKMDDEALLLALATSTKLPF